MNRSQGARAFHAITCLVASFAVVLQLVLVLQGHSPLAPELRPPTGQAVRRFFSYFTIQSNLLVAAVTFCLAIGRGVGTRLWRIARLDALVGITVTGVVHLLLLRPILNLHGLDSVLDNLLHVVVPLLAVVGWLWLGPRDLVSMADVVPSLGWPIAWLVATLALGPLVHWYPYPFLDVGARGLVPVLLTCVVIAILFVGLAAAAVWADRRLPGERAAGVIA